MMESIYLPDGCRSCGLYGECRTYKLPRSGQTPASVLVVSQSPDSWSDEAGEFSGNGHDLIADAMDCMEGVAWAHTYAVKCYPGAGQKPHPHQVTACQEYLVQDLEALNPKVIICLGEVAMKAVWGADAPTSVAKAKGPAHRVGDRWILVTYAPGYFLRDDDKGVQRGIQEYQRVAELADKIATTDYKQEAVDVRLCMTWQDITDLCVAASRTKHVYFDTEFSTNDNDPERLTVYHPGVDILTMSFTFDSGQTFVVPVNHPQSPFNTSLWEYSQGYARLQQRNPVKQEVLNVAHVVMRQKHVVAHSAKADFLIAKVFLGLNIEEKASDWDDTFLMHYSIDQSKIGNGLDKLCERYLGIPDWSQDAWRYAHAIPGGMGTLADTPLQVIGQYNGCDTFYTKALYEYTMANLEAKIAPVYRGNGKGANFSLKEASVFLTEVEHNGLPLDIPELDRTIAFYLHQYGRTGVLGQYGKALQVTPEARKAAALTAAQKKGKTCDLESQINVSSLPFLRNLAQVTDFVLERKTARGADGLNKDEMLQMADGHIDEETGELVWDSPHGDRRRDIWRLVVSIKENQDLLGKFLLKLKKYAVEGRVHGHYNLGKSEKEGGTETGRLSVDKPSLQNLKKDPRLLRLIRARPGRKLLKVDYKAAEYRRLAVRLNLETMIAGFKRGEDPHVAMARDIFKLGPDDPYTYEQRQAGKNSNFAVAYRAGANRLAHMNKIPVDEAREILEAMHAKNPAIREACDECDRKVRAGECFETAFGRRRYYELTGDDGRDAHVYREAWNSETQSDCSDICVAAGIALQRFVKKGVLKGTQILLLVHDAILFEVDVEHLHDVVPVIKQWMEAKTMLPFESSIPFTVDVEVGDTWADLEEYVAPEVPAFSFAA